MHSEFARVLCDGCAQKKVPRFVQVSALNAAASANSEYLRSKAKAEQIAQNAAPTRAVIIRPSVVFGAGDSLTSLFARLAKWTPILALPCAHAAMQPIAVEDLVALIAHCLETGEEDGKILLAGGPEEMTLGDIAARSIAAAGMRRKLIPLGPGLSLALAAVLEKIPGINLISCDNCRAAGYPSTARPNDALRILGELTPLGGRPDSHVWRRRGRADEFAAITQRCRRILSAAQSATSCSAVRPATAILLLSARRPEEMTAAGFKPVGGEFPVFLHPTTGEEYALARTEKKEGRGYRGFVFHAAPDVCLEDDLRRRDLTVNAMAEDDGGKLIDPFGGAADIKKKVLRHVSAAFARRPGSRLADGAICRGAARFFGGKRNDVAAAGDGAKRRDRAFGSRKGLARVVAGLCRRPSAADD